MRTNTMDPLCEKYYDTSPYAWCGNNPVNAVDPFGMDVWTTTDPTQIAAFLQALQNGQNSFQAQTGWKHFSDDDFRVGLSMNTKKGGFNYTYSNVENGEFTVHSLYFPRMTSFGDENSHFDEITGNYNLYTQHETNEAMKFYASIAGGELLGAGIGAVRGVSWLSRLGKVGEVGGELKALGTVRDNLLNSVINPKLQNIISDLYRATAKIGSGSSMDAYQYEQLTGKLVGGKSHGIKLIQYRTALQRLWNNRSTLSTGDRRIVKQLLLDIQNALSGY